MEAVVPKRPPDNKRPRSRPKKDPRSVPIRIVTEDVISEVLEEEKPRFVVDYDTYLKTLWEANPELHTILEGCTALEEARHRVFGYLERTERAVFDTDNSYRINIL